MIEPDVPAEQSRDAFVREAVSRFRQRFGHLPAWASTAPGRVNLIGEHTDYNAGLVLPLAIDRWCVCVGAPAAGPVSRFVAADIDETVATSLGDLTARGHAAAHEMPPWARYLVGAIVERAHGLRTTHNLTGPPELDVLAMSTVPVGGGLSSSAAIETAAAVLIETAMGISPSAGEDTDAFLLARALDCQRAEHLWAGVPCGLMDQIASSFGRTGHALRIDCRDNTIEHVPMPPADRATLLVVNSGVRHTLASGAYAERRATCEALATEFGARSLREIDIAMLPQIESYFNENYTRCGRHVITENDRVQRAVAALRDGRLDVLGSLMYASHASLRNDFRVSCPELDTIVDLARSTPGVFGARMTGGGFGGCAVVLATPEGARSLTGSLPGEYQRACGRTCEIWPVAPSDGAAGHSI